METNTKVCVICGESKPLTEFSRTWRIRTKVPSHWGYHNACKPCDSKKSYAHQKANWGVVQAYRETDTYKRSQKDGWLRLNYNKSLAWYEEKLAKQNGVCALCGQPEQRKTRKGNIKALAVDHDHACCNCKKSCGKCVRDLICESCNHTLGNMADNPKILEAAILYVNRHKKD